MIQRADAPAVSEKSRREGAPALPENSDSFLSSFVSARPLAVSWHACGREVLLIEAKTLSLADCIQGFLRAADLNAEKLPCSVSLFVRAEKMKRSGTPQSATHSRGVGSQDNGGDQDRNDPKSKRK